MGSTKTAHGIDTGGSSFRRWPVVSGSLTHAPRYGGGCWSPSPRLALERMVELNNKWALDGRDPNSYSGILWCLGRHDRPWPPERPIFGTVRYMSSANTARKMNVAGYLEKYGPVGGSLFG